MHPQNTHVGHLKSEEGQIQSLPKYASRAKWEELGFETVGPAQGTVGESNCHHGQINIWTFENVRKKAR